MNEGESMKPGVFSQLYVQLVFAVKYRERLIKKEVQTEVYSYISGILTNRNNKSIIINGMPDHIHILTGLNHNEKIPDLVGAIKRNSSVYINENQWIKNKFQWQEGYGAFSYSRSQIENVYEYIKNQEKHHKKKLFREEYVHLLKQFEIEYDERYLFSFFE